MRYLNALLLSAIVAAMPTILYAQFNLQNFGLRIPAGTSLSKLSPTGNVTARPELVPGVGETQSLVPLTSQRGIVPTFAPVPIKPSVANDSLGFFNESDQQLQFQLFVNDAPQTVMLQPHQLTIIPVGAATQLKGAIGTGPTDSVSSFSAGKLYALRAEAGHWVFAVQ
jgi:hypothetical protein